jgi:hypothetical protein
MASLVLVEVEPKALQVALGMTALAELNVRDLDGHAANYQIVATGVPPEWLHLTPSQLALTAGGQAHAQLEFNVPPDAPPAHYAITLELYDTTTNAASGQTSLQLEVNAAALPAAPNLSMNQPLLLQIEPASQATRDRAQFAVRVTNLTTGTLRVALAAKAFQSDCAFQFSPEQFVLLGNGQNTCTLLVSPLANPSLISELVHSFEVDASVVGEPGLGTRAIGEWIQTPPDTSSAVAAAAAAAAATAATAATVSTATAPAPTERLILTLTPPSQSSAGGATYAVQVANPFSQPVEIQLHAHDETNLLSLTLAPPTLLLGALAQGVAQLTATPIAPLGPQERERANNFVVRGHEAQSGLRAAVQGTLIQTRPPQQLPWLWMGVGAAVILILLLIWGILNNLSERKPVALPSPTILLATPVVITAQPATPVIATSQPPLTVVVTSQPPTVVVTVLPAPTNPPAPTSPPPTPVPPTPVPPTAPPPPFAITGLAVTVNPQASTRCPQPFQFTANFTSNGPGTLQYQWLFSDGTRTDPATITFPDAGKSVAQINQTYSSSITGWGQVQVLQPSPLASNQAPFNLTCPGNPPAPTPTP